MGTTSTAYSNLPRRKSGPRGSVNTQPYRPPAIHNPVFDAIPFTPCPPPVHNSSSFPPFLGPAWASARTAPATVTHPSNKNQTINRFMDADLHSLVNGASK